MTMRPEDPMQARATDNGVADGWRGARIGAELRDRLRREAGRIPARIDLGEPGHAIAANVFLVLALLATAIEFSTYGTSPSPSELSRAGGAGIGVVATGAWWKLLVSNLLHANLAHVATNAFVIFLTGRWLEHLVGRRIVVATILWSALLAAVGSLVVDTPSVAIGASGVAFGLLGCAVAVDPRAHTAVGVIARQLVAINVVLTFLLPGISIGGHLGGLVAGLAVGTLCWDRTPVDRAHPAGRERRRVAPILVAASLPFIAIAAIGPSVLPGEARTARGNVEAWLLERQLAGAELSSGVTVERASCDPTDDLLVYACRTDRSDVVVTFRTRDDQWRLRGG